jgi:hypothetical protein
MRLEQLKDTMPAAADHRREDEDSTDRANKNQGAYMQNLSFYDVPLWSW